MLHQLLGFKSGLRLQAVASKATSKLRPIQEAVKAVAGSAAAELLTLPCAPPLTWNVLKAMLLVMGKTPDHMDTWLKCRSACCATTSLTACWLPFTSLDQPACLTAHAKAGKLQVIQNMYVLHLGDWLDIFCGRDCWTLLLASCSCRVAYLCTCLQHGLCQAVEMHLKDKGSFAILHQVLVETYRWIQCNAGL